MESKYQRYTKEIISKFNKIFEALQNTFGTDIKREMIEGMVDRLYYVEITKKYCAKLLDKAKPKLIIEICYYAMECFAMSKLGHERGIPTAEYSHGFAFLTHTPMQFNPEDEVNELPDYELVYSDSQLPVVNLPKNVSVKTVGFPFFEQQRSVYQKKFQKEEKTIVFISALAEGEQISKIAAEVADKIGDEYHLIYKLHPLEFNYYKERYPWLLNEKLDVIDNNDNHIYRYLAQSSIQIGTRTASIWEGIGFGCDTILLNFGDTAKNMEYFTKEKGVPLVDTSDEVVKLVQSGAAGKVDPDCIFEPNAFSNIMSFIDYQIGKK